MVPVLTRAQMRAFEHVAIETCHVPSLLLMENAGRGAADVICSVIAARSGPSRKTGAPWQVPAIARGSGPERPTTDGLNARVVVVAGVGNNGGDGFVVARHLLARGAVVRVFLTGSMDKATSDCRTNHAAFLHLGGMVTELSPGGLLGPLEASLNGADVVVDAIFGTGLDRPILGHLANVIATVNQSGTHCIALDVPSGLDADSGLPLGIAIQADVTVTFGHLKLGILTPEGARLAGLVHVVDLGVPGAPIVAEVGHAAEVLCPDDVGRDLLPRPASVHKHQAGDVLVIAGSAGKLGAALLTALGAMRTGAGLVTICTWPDAFEALTSRVVEIMASALDKDGVGPALDAALSRRSAVAIGPGLGLIEKARAVVDRVVLGWDGIKVIDADAITHFAGRPNDLASAPGHCILTPHSGELGRLLGKSASDIERDRFGAVREAVEKTRATVVLKGARTIVAGPDSKMLINTAGNPALATAGSGDVLTGIVVALAGSLPPLQAACTGVLVHALAADRWHARTGSDRGMLASEIAEGVPGVMSSLIHARH